ncbi:MAG: type II secretion system F family protein [Thermoguttaceae bacterium]
MGSKSPTPLSTAESAELAAHVADLAKTGLPLDAGLAAVAAELPRGRLAAALRELARQVATGVPLDVAVQSRGVRLPPHVRGLVLAGVRSNSLATALDGYADLARTQQQLRRRVTLSLAYPTLLLFFLVLLTVFFQVAILPAFAAVYRDFGVMLPDMTRFLFVAAPVVMWLFLVGTILLVATAMLSWLIPVQGWLSGLLGWVPLIGPILRWGRLTQFARLMEMLLEQKVPLGEALRLTAGGVRDARLAAACRNVAAEVEAGRSLDESLAGDRRFPPSLIPLVQWGQRASALPEAFRAAAETFEGRTRTQAMLLEVVLPPVAFLAIITFAGFVVSAVMLPMISLISHLSG